MEFAGSAGPRLALFGSRGRHASQEGGAHPAAAPAAGMLAAARRSRARSRALLLAAGSRLLQGLLAAGSRLLAELLVVRKERGVGE